ncbi:amidase [Kineosporia sp. R_H_3]|uniref:amidase n=1 Tax=Kineosporia sp. R_H_3 TaxID=1961848 RepID=UPI0018E91EA0|nr:amidase [Kineosporia sp. R_H_3]
MDPHAPLTTVAELVRSRQVSPVEVADLYLDRIARLDGAVNAIVWLDEQAVRSAAARAADDVVHGRPLGPLHGVPIPIKDLHTCAGQPNTMSSLAVEERIATESDPDVAALLDAGAIPLGRSNSPEFGALTVSENLRHGVTRNPWRLDLTSGGSSGGASAAVAAGFAPAAHASDGGGSIRVPASVTGLVGLKPSRGRVRALVRGWEHSTTEGAITRTVADTALLLDVMSGFDPLSWYSAPAPERPFSDEVGADPGRLRVGLLLDAPTGMPVDDACREAALTVARLLEDAGHDVVPVQPYLFDAETFQAFAGVVISASTWALPLDDPAKVDGYIGRRRRVAETVHAGQYAAVAARLQLETRHVVAQWGRDFDVLLTPTTAVVAPPIGLVRGEANAEPEGPRLTELRMVSFTAFCNVSGLPAITLPAHRTADGVPVGAQLVGGPFADALLIRLASQLEPALPLVGAHPADEDLLVPAGR